MKIKHGFSGFLGAFVILLVTVPPLNADDTEIYFGSGGGTNSNVLFLFDTSGSMIALDGDRFSRMDELKIAMEQILEQSESMNVGFVGLTGYYGGGSVHFPVIDLDSDLSELCVDDGCPGSVVTTRPGSAEDDAIENGATGVVQFDQEFLALADTDTDTDTTGIRFVDVNVPPGATIKSVHLSFTSDTVNTDVASLDISAEDKGFPVPFEQSLFNISSRIKTAAQNWVVPSFDAANTTYNTEDLTPIVQKIVSRSDWCSGNPMHFFLTGKGVRDVVAYEQNSTLAPKLVISYDPVSVPKGSYCATKSVKVATSLYQDDAVEGSRGAVIVNDTELSTATAIGKSQSIGIRFRNVPIPQGALLVSASLEMFSANGVTATDSYTISIEDSRYAAHFSTNDFDISNRTYAGVTENWTLPLVAAGESVFSTDLASLITTVTSRADWASGNSLALKLDSPARKDAATFYSAEKDYNTAPKLHLKFHSSQIASGTRSRDNLKASINALVPRGGTPLVNAYYEAAEYFTGGAVDYGLTRGRDVDREPYRVSHPYSYTDGVVFREGSCSDADLSDPDCVTERIDMRNGAAPTYISPITSECQSNYIVMVTDGVPSGTPARSKISTRIGASCASTTYTDEAGSTIGNSDEVCGRELAHWLANTDLNSELPGRQSVTTHSIGFNLNDPAFAEDVAVEGGGAFVIANNAATLVSAFKGILGSVADIDSSFVAPSATVSQFNRLKNRDDVYFSLFKPKATARWNGNVKRYKLHAEAGQNAVIHDVNGNPAIDETTGEFFPESQSWWSDNTDGSSVTLGGAAEKIEDDGLSHINRNVFTYTGTNMQLVDSTNDLLPGNMNIDLTWFDLPQEKAESKAYTDELISWAHGKDIDDIDEDGDTDEARAEMGDPMHSMPVLVNYDGGKSIVYVATNEGYLHAIDHVTGKEEFAFIPKELLKNIDTLYNNTPTAARPYGLDGGMTTWVDDTNNNGIVDDGEKAYLIMGMRRGGTDYFALDISDYDSPRFQYKIAGGYNTVDVDAATADGDFRELGQSWSKPVKSRIWYDDAETDVLIFAAGYDPNQDPAVNPDVNAGTNRAIDGVGRGIFIVDAITGNELWQASIVDYPDMNYSMPSEVKVIDINVDGLADQMYIGDMGGQVWRFDINNDATTTALLSNRITGAVVAQLADDDALNARKFYYPPDVSLLNTDGKQQLAISIGSGWRAHPLNRYVDDKFYSFRMSQVYGPPMASNRSISYPFPITEADLVDVTYSVGNEISATDAGWMLQLESEGEKVLTTSVTVDNQVLFSTYLPTAAASGCSAAVGSGALYALDLRNGDPVVNLEESVNEFEEPLKPGALTVDDRKRLLDRAGIPPDVAILFPEIGAATVVVGTETVSEIDVGQLRRHTFWAEVLEE